MQKTEARRNDCKYLLDKWSYSLTCNKISNRRVQKVPLIGYLFEHFPDFDFGSESNENADKSGSADESLQSSYRLAA